MILTAIDIEESEVTVELTFYNKNINNFPFKIKMPLRVLKDWMQDKITLNGEMRADGSFELRASGEIETRA